MISVIGIGGAGNQIANEASLLGMHSGAINFSQRDLDSAEEVELKLKLIGSEGVGKNRDEAISLMEKNWETSLNWIKDNFSHHSNEIIVFAFSSGGGSGSGISPLLLDIAMNELDKTFVAMPIMPDKDEVLGNQINCLATFEHLSNLDISVFPIDNEKAKLQSGSLGKSHLYKKANTTAVNLLKKISSYTEKYSRNGNVDQKDLLQIFSTKGIGIMSEVEMATTNNGELKISTNSFTNKIIKSWDESIFSPIEYNQVIRAGIIFDGQEALMEHISYKDIFKKFDKGMPIDLFEGNYHEENGVIYSIMTGLSWCNSRLNEVEYIIEERRKNAENALKETENQTYSSKAIQINSIRKANKPKKSVSDILSKYKR